VAKKAVKGLVRGSAEITPGESFWAVVGARLTPALSRRMVAKWITHPQNPPTPLPVSPSAHPERSGEAAESKGQNPPDAVMGQRPS
jgi:hypothetical protein